MTQQQRRLAAIPGNCRLAGIAAWHLLLELMHGTDLYGARGTAILFVAFFQSEKEVIQQKDRCILGENGDSCNIMGYMSL